METSGEKVSVIARGESFERERKSIDGNGTQEAKANNMQRKKRVLNYV